MRLATLDLGGHDLFVAEGIFARAGRGRVPRGGAARGRLLHHPAPARDVLAPAHPRPARAPQAAAGAGPPGLALMRDQQRVVSHAVRHGCRGHAGAGPRRDPAGRRRRAGGQDALKLADARPAAPAARALADGPEAGRRLGCAQVPDRRALPRRGARDVRCAGPPRWPGRPAEGAVAATIGTPPWAGRRARGCHRGRHAVRWVRPGSRAAGPTWAGTPMRAGTRWRSTWAARRCPGTSCWSCVPAPTR